MAAGWAVATLAACGHRRKRLRNAANSCSSTGCHLVCNTKISEQGEQISTKLISAWINRFQQDRSAR
eukprot:5069830-Pleurochrysis_carterae.AAC.3